jgi:hypothetical protein
MRGESAARNQSKFVCHGGEYNLGIMRDRGPELSEITTVGSGHRVA